MEDQLTDAQLTDEQFEARLKRDNAGTCAMCLQPATIFDGDLCNNCDHIYHGILNVIGEYSGTVSDMPLRAVTARMAVDYMYRQADLTI